MTKKTYPLSRKKAHNIELISNMAYLEDNITLWEECNEILKYFAMSGTAKVVFLPWGIRQRAIELMDQGDIARVALNER